jgi:hypothetical protein
VTAVEPLIARRTPARRKARQLATALRRERPDYAYLKELFRQLRVELGIVVPRTPKRLPYVPSEEEIRRYYETVWKTRKFADLVLSNDATALLLTPVAFCDRNTAGRRSAPIRVFVRTDRQRRVLPVSTHRTYSYWPTRRWRWDCSSSDCSCHLVLRSG